MKTDTKRENTPFTGQLDFTPDFKTTSGMQGIEMPDYVNQLPGRGQKHSGDATQSERRPCQLLLLSFGLLCIIQATLNISLRLSLHSSKESTHLDCNKTHFSDNEVKEVKEVQVYCKPVCNKLQERFNALTRDRDQLRNRNNELTKMIKNIREEKERLTVKLRVLGGCVSPQQCPAGWRKINSSCYFLSNESKTWEDSRKYCQSQGADLVVINNEQEQTALYHLDGEAVQLFWIGLLYDTAGTFKWVDGSALTKPFWQDNQPDHGGDCVEMYNLKPVLASWNDAPCGHKQRWLCEREIYRVCSIT